MKFIKNIITYIENAKIWGKEFVFSMTTNAMLLNKHIDYIVEKNFKLLISLDGAEKNHSYRIKHNGENSFKEVFRNVLELKKRYPDYFEQKVNFNAVLHNRNSVSENN